MDFQLREELAALIPMLLKGQLYDVFYRHTERKEYIPTVGFIVRNFALR